MSTDKANVIDGGHQQPLQEAKLCAPFTRRDNGS